MQKFSKKILLSFFFLSSFSFFLPQTFAAGSTILPKVQEDIPAGQSVEEFCKASPYYVFMDDSNPKYNPFLAEDSFTKYSESQQETYLSCAFSLGLIHLWMVPYFLIYWIEFLIQISGILAVLMFVVGGIYYILGGGAFETISKDKGKTIMTWAITGMVLSLLAWVIVNVVLNFVSQ